MPRRLLALAAAALGLALAAPAAAATPQSAAAKFNGLTAADCSCPTSDVTIASGATQLVEVVDSTLAVYSKTGTLLKKTPLSSIFRFEAGPFVDPEISYDPTNDRFVMVVSQVTPGQRPFVLLGVTATGDATGSWYYYGNPLPGNPDGTAVHPMVGQTATAIAITADILDSDGSYQQSFVWTFNKRQVYAGGAAQSSEHLQVQRGTTPAVVSQSPIAADSQLYLLAPVSASDLHVYALRNASAPLKTTLVDKGSVYFDASPEPVAAAQPGSAVTLPTQYGFTSPPSQLDGRVWWAHTVGFAGYDAVSYGYLNIATMTAHYGFAYHSDTSYDFGPSIVATSYGAQPAAVLNWNYTDPHNAEAATAVYALVKGYTLTRKVGTAYTGAVADAATAAASPTAISADYTPVGSCPAGAYAAVASQYYAPDGTWKTRIGRVGPSC